MPEIQKCLHCTLRATIEEWVQKHGETLGNEKVYNVAEIVDGMAEVMAEFIEMPDDRSQRRRALRFAHDALDAGVKAIRTGQPQPVNIPTEH